MRQRDTDDCDQEEEVAIKDLDRLELSSEIAVNSWFA
jgi:hypothetical protein